MPIPFGIEAETGDSLPGITEVDLQRVDSDRDEVRQRGERGASDHLAIAEIDPNDLAEAGWSVLFASNIDPAVKEALGPLLARRKQQAGPLYKEFEGPSGIWPGDDARRWVERQGASFTVVDPAMGVPLYVLLVGSPAEISFEFQYLLDLYWCVGRLHFDAPGDYGTYVARILAYEDAATVRNRKKAAIFTVRNDADRATGLLHDQVAEPIVNGTNGVRTLTGFKGFALSAYLAEDATKEKLSALLTGREPGGVPAFLFTGSHGVQFRMTDPLQREKQGAILCQDWPGFGPAAADHMFTAADVPDDANLEGLIHYFFACYGGGCPKEDNFGLASGQPPRQLVPEPIIARLPQKMLLQGALASFCHVDRAWAYAFQSSRGASQVQGMRDVMVRILQGQRLGQAVDGFNMRWAVLSADLQESQDARQAFAEQLITSAALANRYVARNDARNYILIGDPAVRLRTDAMVQ
jgi:hypothetical protein